MAKRDPKNIQKNGKILNHDFEWGSAALWPWRPWGVRGESNHFTLALLNLNSLTPKGACERPPFNELCAHVVSPRIFVRCQRLMARKIAELFGLNRGVQPFYAAFRFDELSRGSVSCLLKASFKTAVSQCHNSIF
jgi:hypothetical protein